MDFDGLWKDRDQEQQNHEQSLRLHELKLQAGKALANLESWRSAWSDVVTAAAIQAGSESNPQWDIGIPGPDAKAGAAVLIEYAGTLCHAELIGEIQTDDQCQEVARQLMILALAGKAKPLQAALSSLFATGRLKGQRDVLRALRLLTDTFAGDGIQTRLSKAAQQPEPETERQLVDVPPIDDDPKNWTTAAASTIAMGWFLETQSYAKKSSGRYQAWKRWTKGLVNQGLAKKVGNTHKWQFHRNAFLLNGDPIPPGCGIEIK